MSDTRWSSESYSSGYFVYFALGFARFVLSTIKCSGGPVLTGLGTGNWLGPVCLLKAVWSGFDFAAAENTVLGVGRSLLSGFLLILFGCCPVLGGQAALIE